MNNFSKWLSADVQEFIAAQYEQDLNSLRLKKSPFDQVSMQELTEQIQGRRVAERKFPFLLVPGIVYPKQLSLEQSSSQSTAMYKAQREGGEKMLDLTAGMGIDAYFLSKKFSKALLVEKNKELLEITKHNFSVLNQKVQWENSDLHQVLKNIKEPYDLIYLDPARRDQNQKKVFLLEDLSPNILEIQDRLLEKSAKVLIKLSPMIDLSYLLLQLKNVDFLEVVALKGEVKEVLVHMSRDLKEKEAKIRVVNLETTDPDFEFYPSEETKARVEYSEPLNYLYLPSNGLLKSGAFHLLAVRFGLKKLAPNTHLYTKEEFVEGFPGKVLKVEPMKASQLRKGEQFNIVSKNHPLKPEAIKKKYHLKDGGEEYLIFTQSIKGKLVLKSI